MIFLYSGTPGSGKSLHTASVIYHRLRAGKPVIANFDIDVQRVSRKTVPFFYWDNMRITPKRLQEYSYEYFREHAFKEGKLLLIIDECQLMFNARDWNAAGRSDWLSFFTQHRKFGYDVILVAQFDRMLDRQIRSLIEYEQIHRKVSNFGIKGKLLSAFAFGKLFVAVKIWYPMRERVGAELFVAHKKYYSLYDTTNTFGSDRSGDSGAPTTEEPEASVVS